MKENKEIDLKGKKVLVIGTGLSGAGAVKLLHQIGAVPIVLEENNKLTEADVRARLDEEDRDHVQVVIGALPEETMRELAAVVPSPAVPLDAPTIESLRKEGLPIWSEIEFAYRYAGGKLIAITGTNGKTTTTTLVGDIMKAHFRNVYVVGNIGRSFAGCAREMTEDSVAVAEVSSFQLEAVDAFHADVSAVLNVTPDHLNRHHTMERYAEIKEAVTNRQTGEDTCVLNYDNSYTREMGERCKAHVIYFSSSQKLKEGIYMEGDQILAADGGRTPLYLMNVHDMHLVGTCNVENVMAAIGISMAMGVPMNTILQVIRNFRAVEHRIEYVASKRGVDYYNDSKGTNPDAAIQGIRAMTKPTVLIGGGFDKGSTYDQWIDSFGGKVKKLILVGQTKEKIADCAKQHGFTDYILTETFEEAMQQATKEAENGDAVLLSPACASWGMFPNYEVRGRVFKEYVNRLSNE